MTGDGHGGTLLTATDIANDFPPSVSGTGIVAGDDHTALDPLAGVTVSDLDAGQTESVTLTLSSPLNGTLSNLAGGSYDASTGVYKVSGSTAAVTAALDGLVFTPTINQVAPGQVVTTQFAPVGDRRPDVLDRGGDHAERHRAERSAGDLRHPRRAASRATGTSRSTRSRPSTIADPDVGATETVTLSLGSNWYNPSGYGTLSLVDAGRHADADRRRHLQPCPPPLRPLMSAALDALQFTAVPNPSVPGYTITYVGMSVSDGIAPPVTSQVEVLTGLPIFTGTNANQSVPEGQTIRPFSTVAVTDSAGLTIQGMTITLYDFQQWLCHPDRCQRHPVRAHADQGRRRHLHRGAGFHGGGFGGAGRPGIPRQPRTPPRSPRTSCCRRSMAPPPPTTTTPR